MQEKIKKLFFYFIWALIFSYLYVKFAEMNPFGKDSAFVQNSCKNSTIKTNKLIKYRGFSVQNPLYNLDKNLNTHAF